MTDSERQGLQWVENSLPQLVEGKDNLAAADSLDGVDINISRAIGRAFMSLVIRLGHQVVRNAGLRNPPAATRCQEN